MSKGFSIDSRELQEGEIFFAFSGKNFDAASLSKQAIREKRALAAVVENPLYSDPDQNIFYVPSTLSFLQDLSKYHRERIRIPVIGLTGSNGKTTTKELIYSVLSRRYKTQYTSGNRNNHIGVPLTILSTKPEHEILVLEMGASHKGEIALLCSIAQPDIGYITSFGKSHLEGFGGFRGVIEGKSELYRYLILNKKRLLVNNSDPIQRGRSAGSQKTISFGTSDSDYYFEPFSQGNKLGIEYHGDPAVSQLTGDYNFSNICAAVTLGLHFGLSWEEVKEGVEAYEPTNMRSQILKKNGKLILLDAYNANPSSMECSLLNFSKYDGPKTLILGDMLELGSESIQEHQRILRLAETLGFQEIITVGDIFRGLRRPERAFPSSKEAVDFLTSHGIQGKNVLLKGSRSMKLEELLNHL